MFKITSISRTLQLNLTGAPLDAIERAATHLIAQAQVNTADPAYPSLLARLASCLPTTPNNPDPDKWRGPAPDGTDTRSRGRAWDDLSPVFGYGIGLVPTWGYLCAPLRLEIVGELKLHLAQNPQTPLWVLLQLRITNHQRYRYVVECNPVWPLLQLEDPSLVSLVDQHKACEAACHSVSGLFVDGRWRTAYFIRAGGIIPPGLYEDGNGSTDIYTQPRELTHDTVVRFYATPDAEREAAVEEEQEARLAKLPYDDPVLGLGA